MMAFIVSRSLPETHPIMQHPTTFPMENIANWNCLIPIQVIHIQGNILILTMKGKKDNTKIQKHG